MADRLTTDQQLNTNNSLVAPNGKVTLIMQSDGNLVLYRSSGGPALWASNTVGKPVIRAIMQSDGNFVCYDAQGKPYWESVTYGNPGAYLLLQDDGNLVVYSATNAPLWASNTGGLAVMADRLTTDQQLNTNNSLVAPNGKVTLIMQSDGNLVLYRSSGGPALWASNTVGKPVIRAIMQSDGNFVCYDAQGKPYWESVTYGNPGAYLLLQDDGNLVVYSATNAPLWASNTGAPAPAAPIPADGGHDGTLTSFIRGIPKLPVYVSEVTNVGSPSPVQFESHNGVPSAFTSQAQNEKVSYGSLAAFDPNADVLWPGSIVQGSSIRGGILSPIALPRKATTITLTNLMVDPASSQHPMYSKQITNPTLATTHDAIQELLRQNFSPTPSVMSYAIYEYHSTEHGLLKIGLDAHWVKVDIKSTLDIDVKHDRTNVVVQYVQRYFSVSCNPPSSPAAFFADSVDVAQASQYLGAGNPPVYVASISYGRSLYFFISSASDTETIKLALTVTYSAPLAGGSASISAEHATVVNSSSIRVLALGGAAATVLDTITKDDKVAGIRDYLKAGANFSPQSPGIPISYELRYLADNDVARLSLAADYSLNSYRAQVIKKVTVIFELTSDDKDKEETIQLTVCQGNRQIGYGEFGSGVKWKDPGTYPCDIDITGSASELGALAVEMYKTPFGSPTGNGMEGRVQGWCTLEDGSTIKWLSIREKRYGDNNPYRVKFSGPDKMEEM